MATELTSAIVKEYAIKAGADVVGIACAGDFSLAPEGFGPVDVLTECRSVIVLGATFSPEVLKDIDEYTASRNEMISTMTDMAKKAAKQLKSNGYKSKAISATGGKWIEGGDGKKVHFGYISLKHAAEIAGIGIIGKNYLLTNRQYGNLLWLSAVLTDAELIPDEKAEFVMCVGCNRCIRACPEGALDELKSFGRKECSKYYAIENKKLRIKCFLCRTVCPNCFGLQMT